MLVFKVEIFNFDDTISMIIVKMCQNFAFECQKLSKRSAFLR